MPKSIFKNISKIYLKSSLLKKGLFSDKIIPIFDGTKYAKFVLNSPSFVTINTNQHYSVISHRIVSHKNSVRMFQIPHPHSFAILCSEICKSWDKIANITEKNWNGKKINMLHIRKMASQKDCIFCMDYSSKTGEVSDALLKKAIGMKYMVRADISTFFPSIYSHSVAWVAVGRSDAFLNRHKKNLWYNKLDAAIVNSQEKESVGLPIGPHTSNIISDLVLSSVDKKLLEEGFEFIRYIDDYQCFTESKERAEEFLVLLSDELTKIRLNVNRSKTKIKELPHVFNHTWPYRIKSFNFSKRKRSKLTFDDKNYSEIIYFLDYASELSKQENDEAPLRYAIKMLKKSKFSTKAFEVFEKYVQHLILLYPYLSDFVYDIYMSKKRFPAKTEFVDNLFIMAVQKKLHASISRAIYACLFFNIKSNKIVNYIGKILETEDCISITALMLYCFKFKVNLSLIIDFSKEIIRVGRTDEYWVLIYELFRMRVLKESDLKNNYDGYQAFKLLKAGNVSFVKNF